MLDAFSHAEGSKNKAFALFLESVAHDQPINQIW